MATESPIRFMEPSGKWPSHNELVAFGGIEDMGSRFQDKKRTLPPNRSGSAPPSMEGSFAAIENLIFRHKIAAKASLATPNRAADMHDPEEQLRADPSYFAYYWAHVNLNPRPPPPLISDENRHLFSTGNNQRFASFDDSSNVSLRLSQINLSTHKEESDDDPSPKQSIQEDSYKHESIEETDNASGGDGDDDDDVSTSAVTNPHVSGINNGNTSSIPNSESQRDRFQIHGSHTQVVSQSQTYVAHQFIQTPANFSPEVQRVLHSSGFTPPQYASGSAYVMSGNHVYPNMMPAGYYSQQYTIGGYAFNPPPISPYVTGYLPMPFDVNAFMGPGQTSGVNLQHLNKFYGHLGLPIQPSYGESFQLSAQEDYQIQKQQSLGIMGQSNMNFANPRNMGVHPFANSPLPGSPVGVRNGIRSSPGQYASWQAHSGVNQVFKDPKTYSFLEELKSGKGRRFELSDIFGHVFEFCADQHGSRFIQQKLESCRIDEKESVFKEVLPNASSLITDVFGNYVIQKFFEYGSAEQRRDLANRLEGQILPLSLQMYGCRVIQKALDAIELEQKIKLVHELDGHVLRCVRDQNGNHVIQKCIESIPTEKIKFVISSFRGQVAALSTHPYGCRVIQRVLEHSTDELQSQFIVDEILESVYTLSQDQYGNYVTQHVLERGKAEERVEIVRKLSGHIVQLSQHKFASNVIEKCLEYGNSTARGMMIEEIVGLADSSDNLLAMVKDQFANYVIQKVLQTCTGDQREVLLGRIKVHLNSLKKYTYGKHIVARFEQLYGEEIQGSGS